MQKGVTGKHAEKFKCSSISFEKTPANKECLTRKQPFKGALRKRCFENMQQIYRRTPMPKCDFNKVASLQYA